MKAVIMAGGKGTRIASLMSDVPKPMIPVCGKPILEYQIDSLKTSGITDITLVIGHLGHVVKNYFGDGSRHGVSMSYFEEITPLGTAGALYKIPNLTDDFLLLCGDLILDVDFKRFIEFHKGKHAWASLLVHPNDHPYDSSIIVTEYVERFGEIPQDSGKVIAWLNKEELRECNKNCVNAGVQIISPKLLRYSKLNLKSLHTENPDKIDLDRDVLKPSIPSGKIFAYHTSEYVKDMGTPERYYQVENDIKTGRVESKNLRNKQRAVFLDRDGTINVEKDFLKYAEDFELIEGVADAIRIINRAGWLVIVTTNQPVIARGECSFVELQRIHDTMETELGKQGAYVDGIYYCPHHPDSGFEGERLEYKLECICRKPNPGLLLNAAKDFNIDLAQSVMIGDREKDVLAGERAGCERSILIEKNEPNALLKAIREVLQ